MVNAPTFDLLPSRNTSVALSTVLGLVAILGSASSASGQVIGTFSWQTQPYCNAITVTAIQVGSVHQLTGTDNRTWYVGFSMSF